MELSPDCDCDFLRNKTTHDNVMKSSGSARVTHLKLLESCDTFSGESAHLNVLNYKYNNEPHSSREVFDDAILSKPQKHSPKKKIVDCWKRIHSPGISLLHIMTMTICLLLLTR